MKGKWFVGSCPRAVRRMLVSFGLVLLLVSAAVGTVGADPVKAKNAQLIEVTCGGQTFTVVVNGRGQFTPGHIIGSTGNLIPQSFTFTVIATNARGEVLFSGTATVAKGGQRRGLQDRLITCTFGQTFTEDGITFAVSGTVTGFITPRGR